jgi:hypothetical protein
LIAFGFGTTAFQLNFSHSGSGIIWQISALRPPWVLTKEEGMSDDRTKADKAWEARQEAARYRIFNAATNAAEATDRTA